MAKVQPVIPINFVKTTFHLTTTPFSDGDPLQKSKGFGTWNGLKVIAIGPKGGKIVGYGKGNKPIYAGSSQAKNMAAQNKAAQKEADTSKLQKMIMGWLESLGITTQWPIAAGFGEKFMVDKAAAEQITAAFGLKPDKGAFKVADIKKHIGKPLVPAEEDQAVYAAKAASGELEQDAFPVDLNELKFTGTKKGSHGGKVFEDKKGNKFLFKAENSTIARAEEAASRIAKLVLGPDKVQASKYVKLNGQDGILIRMFKSSKEISPEHGKPSDANMQKHFDDIIQHHVLDWVISNHDAHGGNFILDKEGLKGIDKGQAFKAFVMNLDEALPEPGKEHSKAANPNPSQQIYSYFWEGVHKGTIKGDPMPAVQKAFTNLAKISPDQLKALVAPYVQTVSKFSGKSPGPLEKKILARFMEAKGQWETFLSKVLKTKVTISEDNFETMPEGKGKEAPKFEIPNETKAPEPKPQVQKVQGWPQKQGKVTVHHPGGEWPAGVKGFKGYPGTGYTAEVNYKGQKIKFEFVEDEGKARVLVTWPDGASLLFGSPSQAADALVLKDKGMDLYMSSVEKKAKKISYPAKTLLNLKAFDFSEQAVEPPPKLDVPKTQKTYSMHEGLSKLPNHELLHDWDHFPVQAQEFLDKWVGKKAPANWKGEFPPPGHPFKYTMNDGSQVLCALAIDADGKTPIVYRWPITTTGLVDQYVDIGTELGYKTKTALTVALSSMPDHLYDAPEAPPVGPAPKAVPTKEAKVETTEPEPEHHEHPLANGKMVKVQKKFSDGTKKEIKLQIGAHGEFMVWVGEGSEGTPGSDYGEFTSISAAAKWAWVHTKGYLSVEDYQKDSPKPAPGVNWPFFKLESMSAKPKPGPKAKPPAPAPEPEAATEPEPEAPKKPTPPKFKVGDKIMIEGLNEPYVIEQVLGWSDFHEKNEYKVRKVSGGGLLTFSEAGMVAAEPAPSAPNWQSMPEMDLDSINLLPTGTKIKTPGMGSFEKETFGWKNLASGDMASAFAEAISGYKYGDAQIALPPGETLPKQWDTFHVDDASTAMFEDAPVGTEVSWEGTPSAFDAEKVGEDSWTIQTAFKVHKDLSSQQLRMILQGVSPNKEVLPPKSGKFVMTKGAGAVPSVPEPTPAPAELPPQEYPEDKILTQAPPGISGDAQDIFGDIVAVTDKWLSLKIPDGTTADKPPGWASWVPPPGVVTQGMLHGKKIWFAPSVSGYGKSGKTDNLVQFVVFDEDGNKALGTSSPSALMALDDALSELKDQIGYSALKAADIWPGYLETKYKAGANAANFTIDPPPSAEKITKTPEAMSSKEASQNVVADIPFQDAWEHLPEVKAFIKKHGAGSLILKKAGKEKHHNIIIDKSTPLSETEAQDEIQKIAETYGLKAAFPNHPKTGWYGTFFTFSDDQLAKHVGVTMPAADVPSIEVAVPGEDNFATMPESEKKPEPKKAGTPKDYPKKLPKSWKGMKIETHLEELPEGTKILFSDGTFWTKEGDEFTGQTLKGKPVTVSKFSLVNKVQSKGGAAVQLKGYPKPKLKMLQGVVFKATPYKPPKASDPEMEAKKQWAKSTKPVSPEVLSRLAYLGKKLGLAEPVYARQQDDGTILLGEGTTAFGSKLTAAGVPSQPVETPFGTLFSISEAGLKKATPEAETMKGPDGLEYPVGTTFEEKEVTKPLSELMKELEGFTKLAPFKSMETGKIEEGKHTVKLSGIGAEQMTQAKAIVEKLKEWGVEVGKEPWKGGSYTMFGPVDAAALKKTKTVGMVTKAKKPKPPEPFKVQTLPSTTSLVHAGQEAQNNREDLAQLHDIDTPMYGHAIRFGKAGVMRDGQLRASKIQKPDGKRYIRIWGELSGPPKKSPGLTAGSTSFNFSLTKKDEVANKLDSGYKKQNIDEEGFTIQTSQTIVTAKSKNGTTDGGTQVALISNSDQKYSLRNRIMIDVPVGADIETEVAHAMEMAGVDVGDAMGMPTETDERIFKKHQIVRADRGPGGYSELQAMGKQAYDEEWLDAELKARGYTQADVDSAKIIQTAGSQHSVVLDDEDKIKKAGAKFAYIHWNAASVTQRILEGVGTAGTTQRLMEGTVLMSGGQSVGSDMNTGGGHGSFARISHSMSMHGVALIIHPRALQRTDWHLHTTDQWGAVNPTHGHFTKKLYDTSPGGPDTRYAQIKNSKHGTNEVIFEQGIGLQDLAGIQITNSSERNKVKKLLTEQGITEVNGIPLDEFITGSVSEMPGLTEEGVLP